MPSLINIRLKTDNEEAIRLCNRFWAYDAEHGFEYKISQLSQESNIPARKLTKFVRQHCDAISTEDICSECNNFYVFSNRSDFQQHYRSRQAWKCEECEHKEGHKKAASLYERDHQAWWLEQNLTLADGQLDKLDRGNLTKEISLIRNTGEQEIIRNLERVLQLLLEYKIRLKKTRYKQDQISMVRQEMVERLRRSPCLTTIVLSNLQQAYCNARQLVCSKKRHQDDLLPEICPFTLDQICDPKFFPGDPLV